MNKPSYSWAAILSEPARPTTQGPRRKEKKSFVEGRVDQTQLKTPLRNSTHKKDPKGWMYSNPRCSFNRDLWKGMCFFFSIVISDVEEENEYELAWTLSKSFSGVHVPWWLRSLVSTFRRLRFVAGLRKLTVTKFRWPRSCTSLWGALKGSWDSTRSRRCGTEWNGVTSDDWYQKRKLINSFDLRSVLSGANHD